MTPDLTEDLSVESFKTEGTALQTILDSLFDGVYVVDLQRKILFWNKGAEAITGYPRAEVLGRRCSENILNHIDEDGRLVCTGDCPLVKTLATGGHNRLKLYPLNKKGGRFPVMTHVAPLHGKDGRIFAAIEVFRDISKEEELRVLQEKFNALIKKYVSSSTYEQVTEQVRSSAVDGTSCLRDLTILYLDIASFTTFSEKSTPEEVVQMLNKVFGVCGVITKECQGDIDKFIGDAIMAVFVDADDAVKAGTLILDALARMNEERRKEGKDPVHVRIGVNSGNVLQGDIGTTERKDRTVIGDTVNTASRIQTACEPDSVFISEAVFARIKQQDLFKFHDKIKVKGKKDPLPLYKLARPASSRPLGGKP